MAFDFFLSLAYAFLYRQLTITIFLPTRRAKQDKFITAQAEDGFRQEGLRSSYIGWSSLQHLFHRWSFPEGKGLLL